MVVKKFSPMYTFDQFNSELNELYNYLKSEKYHDDEIKRVFSPLTSQIKQKSNLTQYIFLSTIALILFTYFLTYFDDVYWHISAIGRIVLIKILPYFDWRYLKDKHCLIDRLGSPPSGNEIFFNCDLCEHVNNIDVYEHIDEEVLSQRYIELDVPLIISKGVENWPKNSSFIEDLLTDDVFYYSHPCKVSTNIHKGGGNVGKILEKTPSFDEFFLHFQNCELDAMKIFRKFTYRPKFLPSMYSPVLYNWLIWNRNYNTTNQKVVELVEKLAIVGQLFGSTYFQLIPRHSCIDICPVLDIKLNAGEALIFTSLWNLEYTPNEEGENMAVILETHD